MIIPADVSHADAISALVLKNLSNPDPRFSKEFIEGFRKHARIENIRREFDNPDIIAFVAVNGGVVGFVVGYAQGGSAFLHCMAGDLRPALLSHFVEHCKKKGFRTIKTDTYAFMENYQIYLEAGFVLDHVEATSPETLWLLKTL